MAKSFTEQIEVGANELVDKIKSLMQDAGAKRVVIRNEQGKELLAVPLGIGIAGGAFVALSAPVLTAVAAIAGKAAKFRLDVERTDGEDDASGEAASEPEGEQKA